MTDTFRGRTLRDDIEYLAVLALDARRIGTALEHHHKAFFANAEVQGVLRRFAVALVDAANNIDHAAGGLTPKVRALIEAH